MQLFKKRYDKFAGVDFGADAAKISDYHACDARNMIADSGGCPEKRVGYKRELSLDARINGIFKLDDMYVIHAGEKMYIWNGKDAPTEALSGVNDDKSTALEFRKKLYILTGKDFLVFDGDELSHVHDKAYVPLVLTNAEYNADDAIFSSYALYGGDVYQPFNLLTGKRRISVTKTWPGYGLVIRAKTLAGSVKLYDLNGEEIKEKFYTVSYSHNGDEFIADAFEVKTYEATGGGDQVEQYILEYEVVDEKTQKNRAMLENCKFMAVYENRLFLGGNPDYSSVDFHCELNDATYFTDISYTSIGTADEKPDEAEEKERAENSKAAEILGYSHIDGYLAVHKDNSSGGASIYLRSSQLSEEEMIFPITEGISGEPIVSHHTINSLIDDALFVTKSGVYALGSADVTHKRCLSPRGSRVAPRLVRENLTDAVSCVYDGYYMLFVGGNVYVADSRQKSYARNYSNEYEYEWYFWDNVPARCVHSDEFLWFGTDDGRICRFMTELYGKPEAYNDDGEAIVAEWTTKMDDFGTFETLKNLRRRGSGVYVKTYACMHDVDVSVISRHEVEVEVVSEHDFGKRVAYATRGIFNFENLDFSRFSFNTIPYSFVDFELKVKNFRMAQVKCANDKINEPFGVMAIELCYQTGGFAK